MKLYTKTGDGGTTGLFGGQRVEKDHPRVEAYGTVDELNSVLGWCVTVCDDADLGKLLNRIQSRLFDIGANLATSQTKAANATALQKVPAITQAMIDELEQAIDATCAGLPDMKYFILPGGTELAGRLHIARTVCRRAERRCLSLKHQEQVSDAIIIYLNRLSDLLFALARHANQQAAVEDVPWKPDKSSDQ